MYLTLSKWLRSLSIDFSENELKARLESHPDYPSLLAVQDTLREFDVKANSYQIEVGELDELSQPFLAHFHNGEEHLRFFTNSSEAKATVNQVGSGWSGVVMIADGQVGNFSPGKVKSKNHQRHNQLDAVILMVGCLLFLIGIVSQSTIASGLLLLTALIGCSVSWLILAKELGIQTNIADRICSLKSVSSCEAVLRFGAEKKLFGLWSWGDISLSYFSSLVLYYIYLMAKAGALSGSELSIVFILSLSSIIVIGYSLYIQIYRLKNICMLCLAVIAVLIANVIATSLFVFWIGAFQLDLELASVFFSILLITTFAWRKIRPLFIDRKNLEKLSIRFLKMRRDPLVFESYLNRMPFSEANFPQQNDRLHYGNKNAPLQIVIACSPFCVPCSIAHHAIERLSRLYPQSFGVSIRFAIPKGINNADQRYIAASDILETANEGNVEAIVRDWYQSMDLDAFRKLNPSVDYNSIGKENTSMTLQFYEEWTINAKIDGTPTFFINGRRLPKEYGWIELLEIMEYKFSTN